jgi:hypothetical protein
VMDRRRCIGTVRCFELLRRWRKPSTNNSERKGRNPGRRKPVLQSSWWRGERNYCGPQGLPRLSCILS